MQRNRVWWSRCPILAENPGGTRGLEGAGCGVLEIFAGARDQSRAIDAELPCARQETTGFVPADQLRDRRGAPPADRGEIKA